MDQQQQLHHLPRGLTLTVESKRVEVRSEPLSPVSESPSGVPVDPALVPPVPPPPPALLSPPPLILKVFLSQLPDVEKPFLLSFMGQKVLENSLVLVSVFRGVCGFCLQNLSHHLLWQSVSVSVPGPGRAAEDQADAEHQNYRDVEELHVEAGGISMSGLGVSAPVLY